MYLIQTVSSTPVGRRSSGLTPMEEGGETHHEGKKKWSIGKLFRRKKKESESDASSVSSDDTSQKHNAKRKKTSKKRSSTPKNNYDRDSNQNGKRSQSVTKFSQKEYVDEGVLSDPSAGFNGYVGRGLPRSPLDHSRFRSKESLEKRGQGSSCGSQDGSLRKGRKGRIKARVEAMRNSKNDSSSDDESQKSTSSSMLKFKSDDSLANHSKDGSVSKRSRSARNDRYNKRLSRDDEAQLNKEADLIQKGFSRSEAELLALKHRVLSTPQMNGNYGKLNDEPDYSEPFKVSQPAPYDTRKSCSGSQLSGYANILNGQSNDRTKRHQPVMLGSNSVYSYPAGVINFNAQVNDESISYSVPYNINKQSQFEVLPNKPNFRRSASVENNNGTTTNSNYDNDVMVVKLPLGVPRKEMAAPPPPPLRDPQRKVSTPISYMYENTRPVSYGFELSNQRNSTQPHNNYNGVVNNHISTNNNVYENSAPIIKQMGLSWGKRPISSSEDHIAMQQNYKISPAVNQNIQPRRPSSVTGEVIRPELYNRYMNRPQIISNQMNKDHQRRHTQENANPEFLYFADKTPRSRRPIHIASTPDDKESGHLNHPQSAATPRNASDFWKRMDVQECQRRRIYGHNRTLSDQSVTGKRNVQSQTTVQMPIRNQNPSMQARLSNGSIENIQHNNIKRTAIQTNKINIPNKKENKENEPICYSNIDIIPMDDVRHKSDVRHRNFEDDNSSIRRKSTNLEDALSELEAIYNSLGLGDEDLLDRAERQELMSSKTADSAPYSSDDNYFRFPSVDCPDTGNRRLSLSDKKSVIPDKKHDDMAYRRLNPHERPKSKDANNLVSQVSYMLASPVLSESTVISSKPKEVEEDEPDVILDDVVYRNIRQANNYLKIEDPQPPFGIPIGPITPAPNSDYLHAVPESKSRSRIIPQESPDIVADDLAYRALRKDFKNVSPINKELTGCIYNNTCDNENLSRPSKLFDNHVIKKKRAVRSLSANIFTLVQREIDDALNVYNNHSLEKSQSIPDLPEAVVEFGKSGKIPENFRTSQQLLQETSPPTRLFDNRLGKTESISKVYAGFSVEPRESESKHFSEVKSTPLILENNIVYTANHKKICDNKDGYDNNCDVKTFSGLQDKQIISDKKKAFLEYQEPVSKIDNPVEVPERSSSHFLRSSPKRFVQDFQDDLDTMAREAKETSAKLVIALEELQRDKLEKNKEITHSDNISLDTKINQPISNDPKPNTCDKNIQLKASPSKENHSKISMCAQMLDSTPNIKVMGTIPSHIKEKMEEFSKFHKNDSLDDSSNQMQNFKTNYTLKDNLKDNSNFVDKTKGEDTEDSLILISNQLKIVGTKLKSNTDTKEDIFKDEGTKFKSLAEKCITDINKNVPVDVTESAFNQLKYNGYEAPNEKNYAIVSLNPSKAEIKCLSPKVLSVESKVQNIESMQSFDELRKGISELLDGIGTVTGKLQLEKENRIVYNDTPEKKNDEEIINSERLIEEALVRKNSDSRDSPEYNSSEELAMIFNLNEESSKPSSSKAEMKKMNSDDRQMELNSPRLVKNANKNLSKAPPDGMETKEDEPMKHAVATVGPSTEVPWRRNRRSSTTDSGNKGVV